MSASRARPAERWLLDRELFGMRFGLDRMRRLLTVLGSPQDAFASVHVVGTNGKSSTVRMTAAILQRHGLSTGAYLSPHLVRFAERVRIDDADLDDDAFAAAVERVARAAEKVDRTLSGADRVTQFEALTAVAYDQFARRGVDVAVVEAGLGGRWDATNVVDSGVQVLTNVGLEHTRWLGPTVTAIAREKLAVVRDGATLVVGPGPHPDALAEARAAAERHHARLVVAPEDPGVPLAAPGGFQRRNFALARAAAEAHLGALDEGAVRAAAASVEVPGRLQVAARAPLTLLDGAHNPSGMRALAEALPAVAGDRRLVALVGVLDDKDAGGMLGALLDGPAPVHSLVCTRSASPRSLPPATLASLAAQLGWAGGGGAHIEPDAHRALERARDLAGADGAVVATGSIYLVADLVRGRGPAGAVSRL